MKLKLETALAAACLTVSLFPNSRSARHLPSKTNLSNFGCSVQPVEYSPRPGVAPSNSFELTVWAEHGGKRDFEQVYSVRPKIRSAFNDCGKWAEQVWDEK